MSPRLEKGQVQPRLEIDKYLVGLTNETRQQMASLIDDSYGLYDWAVGSLAEHGLTPASADMLLKGSLINGENPVDANVSFKHELAAEFRHVVHHVLGTTLELKKHMIQHDMPERVIAYQTGTGFPLPEEIEGVEMITESYIPFGEGRFEFLPKPGVPGHAKVIGGNNESGRKETPKEIEEKAKKGDAAPGLYFYIITAPNNRKMTLVVVNGRYHGYEAKASKNAYPHHILATLPRVLKGIGVESILTTFASGYDAVAREGQKTPSTGDYGYILTVQDLIGETNITHPAIGDQTLLGPLFGGPFRETISRCSDKQLIARFESAIRHLYPDGMSSEVNMNGKTVRRIPQRHPTLFFDTISGPDFESMVDWAIPRSITDQLITNGDMLDPEVLDQIPSDSISSNQGMSATAEIATYHQAGGSVKSIFNRKVPNLEVTNYTDAIDPRVGGQSSSISHEEVQAAGRRGQKFIAPVISEYARQIASLYTKTEDINNIRRELELSDSKHDKALLKELDHYIVPSVIDFSLGAFYRYLEEMKDIYIRYAKNVRVYPETWNQKVSAYEMLAGVLAEKMGLDRGPYI